MGACPICGGKWKQPEIRMFGDIMVNDSGAARLGHIETTIMAALLRGPVRRSVLLDNIYAARDNTPPSASQTITGTIRRLREKLGPMGLTISNIHPRIWGGAMYALEKTARQ